MVTTFNARLQSLTNRCNKSTSEKAIISTSETTSSKGSITTKNVAVERQGSHYFAHVHHKHHTDHHGGTSNKRRRHNEELEFSAASIESACSAAGRSPVLSRRERALPLGSVDMDGAKVVTSREFDIIYTTENEAQEDYNLLSMYMIAGLIQATRHYYCFSGEDKKTFTTTTRMVQTANSATDADTTSISNDNTLPITTNQSICETATIYTNTNNFNDEKVRKDNSEGLSSWAPSASSCRHNFNYCDTKSIDDDNRSYEQSSDMAKEESSSSSLYSLASNDGDDVCKNYDGPYSVIG